MRTIPFFLISLGLMVAACTTEPKRPDDPHTPVCTEECTKDSECWTGTVCSVDKRCVAPGSNEAHCKTTADCVGGGTCGGGVCKPCTKNSECAGSKAGAYCDLTSPDGKGFCSACLDDKSGSADTGCTAAAKACGGGACGECTDDHDCIGKAGTPRCSGGACVCATDEQCKDPGLGLCRAEGCVCSDDSGCTKGAKKCAKGMDGKFIGACIQCETDAHCADFKDPMDPTKPFKSKCLANTCGCASDAECGGGFCDTMTGACSECRTSADCKTSAAGPACVGGSCAVCDPAKTDMKTNVNSDCVAAGLGSICDTSGDAPACTCDPTDSKHSCKPATPAASVKWVCE